MSHCQPNSRLLQISILVFSAAAFLAFVYGYPRLFSRIEAADPIHFEQNVAAALSEGNLAKAVKIARRAQVRKTDAVVQKLVDPLAYVILGQLLLQEGKVDEALKEINAALTISKEQAAPFRETRRYHYFAPARLALGKYYFEQGDVLRAIGNFELAHGYDVSSRATFTEFHACLYQAYAASGLWARALELKQSVDVDVDAVNADDLVAICRISVARHQWELARRAAEKLASIDGSHPEAHFSLGRALHAQGQTDASAAHLKQAAAAGQPYAAFFLGSALAESGRYVEAVRAFLSAPEGDVYRAFALAAAHALSTKLPQGQSAVASPQEILGLLDAEMAALLQTQRLVIYDDYQGLVPVAFNTCGSRSASGGPFPLLILWTDTGATSGEPGFTRMMDDPTHMLLKRGGNVLQLQWVENLVPWECVERLEPGGDYVPGWIDSARDWFDLRKGAAAQIQKNDQGNGFIAINKLTWFYSVPVHVADGASYLLAGRVKAPEGKAGLAWQAANTKERVVFEDSIRTPASPGAWTWRAACVRSQLFWDTIRVQLDVLPRAGTVEFDDIMLAEIQPPNPDVLSPQ